MNISHAVESVKKTVAKAIESKKPPKPIAKPTKDQLRRWAQQEASALEGYEDEQRRRIWLDKADRMRCETIENVRTKRQDLIDSGMTEGEVDTLLASLIENKSTKQFTVELRQ